MNGIEKIILKINEDSASRCDSILAGAKKECDGILAAARANGEKFAAQAAQAAEDEAGLIISMAESGAAQASRQAVLAAKVGIINDTLGRILDEMRSLPPESYFAAVIRLACENAMKGSCTAKLAAMDLERLPDGFSEQLVSALAEKGAECVLSDESAPIGSGILLIYGDIEINCSFEAVIEANSDQLKSKIGEILFQAVNE